MAKNHMTVGVQRKRYEYSIGDVSLGFSLRTDAKKELKHFKELMQRAIRDIDEDIAKVPKNG